MSAALNPMMQAALDYRACGLAPIPLCGKTPVVSDWSRRRPLKTNELYGYFYADPRRYNIGLVMGNGLVAIDLDPRDGGFESWNKLIDGRTLPMTAKAETGGLGRHLVFRTPVPFGCIERPLGLPGIGIKGVGGQIAVEPSLNRETTVSYRWLVRPPYFADMPGWLIETLRNGTPDRDRDRPDDDPQRPLRRFEGTFRAGDVQELTRWAIERFPIRGPGCRASVFARLIPNLVGQGFKGAVVEDVAFGWWADHHERGLCRTGPRNAKREARSYVARLARSERFGPATSTDDHRERCRGIGLDDDLTQRLGRKIGDVGHGATTTTTPDADDLNTIRLSHPIHNHFHDDRRVCETVKERAFVEALIVQSTHHLSLGQPGPIRFTGEQIRQVVNDRHPSIDLKPAELERLMLNYIDRPPDKPARRLSLMSRIVQGRRATGRQAASPSEYEPTGISAFLGSARPN